MYQQTFTDNGHLREQSREAIVLAEIEHLREDERRLERLFSKLEKMPRLRDEFLSQLSELNQRTHRLSRLLDPPRMMPAMALRDTGGSVA